MKGILPDSVKITIDKTDDGFVMDYLERPPQGTDLEATLKMMAKMSELLPMITPLHDGEWVGFHVKGPRLLVASALLGEFEAWTLDEKEISFFISNLTKIMGSTPP